MDSKLTISAARWRGVFTAALLFLLGATAHAQQSTVTFSEDFQTYGKSKKPAGWIDTKVGSPNVRPRGYYKTRIDPTQDKNSTAIAYGTTKSIADKLIGGVNRGGYFAVYQPKVFSAIGRFEVTGRMIRISTRSRAGLTVLNGYPEKDKYYLIREESTGSAAPTLRLSAFGAGTPTGKLDSEVSLAPGKWYRFRIATDSVAGVTNIRARFWLDGTTEPSTYAIDATDSSASRLVSGRFGVWAGGTDKDEDADLLTPATQANDDDDETLPPTRGTYVDDLNLKSPADTGAPTIEFYENNLKLDTTRRTDFNRNAAIDIRIADALSTTSYVATLNDTPYRSLQEITTEGVHVLKVRATDAVGNFTDAEVSILVDKTAPVISLFENDVALADGSRFNRTARIRIVAEDNLSTPTYVARLEGQRYTSLDPIAAEGTYVLLVEATDGVGNSTPKQVSITIDLTPPVISFLESGSVVTSANAKFKTNPSIEIRAMDGAAVTLTPEVTLNGQPYQSKTPITVDGRHVLVATVTDAAGNSITETLNLLVDKVAPVIVLRDGTTELDVTKPLISRIEKAIGITVTDATSTPEWSAKLEGVEYSSGTLISAEKTHTLTVHAADESGNETDVTLTIVIDKTAPEVSFFEGETKQLDPRVSHLFNHTVGIRFTATDATSTPVVTAKLDGQDYTSLAPISGDGPHVIVVTATDAAGNVATADVELRFEIDTVKPVIVLKENDELLASGAHRVLNRPAVITITATDTRPGLVDVTAKLDDSVYTSGTAIAEEGPHTLTVRARDLAGNEAEASATLLIDTTGPTIQFFHGQKELLAAEPKHKFNELPSIRILVSDVHAPTYDARLGDKEFKSLDVVPEGIHTLTVNAQDSLQTPTVASIALLVDLTKPVIELFEGDPAKPLVPIYNRALKVTPKVSDLSTTEVTATLNGQPFDLDRTIAEDGKHTLIVTAVDELGWTSSVSATFVIDTTRPVVTVLEGTTPLLDGKIFARDIVLTKEEDDRTTVTVTATLNGQPYTFGTTIAADGEHTLVVNAIDEALNEAPTQTIRFYIERANPEVTVKVDGKPFKANSSFNKDIVITVDVVSVTTPTITATIDGVEYVRGTPYGIEAVKHTLVVVAATAAGKSTTVTIDFEIDKTPPTIRLMANGAPMTEGQLFGADFTPVAEVHDNQTEKPVVVITLDGQVLGKDEPVTIEQVDHVISAVATDRAGNSTPAGPFQFTLDKSDSTIEVFVDDKLLETGALFDKAITPVVKVTDLTTATWEATIDGQPYVKGAPVSGDGRHTFIVTATDLLQRVTVGPALEFTIDTTRPVVTVLEANAPFVSGTEYKRSVTPTVDVQDTTPYTITATLDGEDYTPGNEITAEGHHELKVLVTDEVLLSTVVTISFTIDNTSPAYVVVERATGTEIPFVSDIYNRDVRPKIVVTDATSTVIKATDNDDEFTNDTLITKEGPHVLTGTITDELDFVTQILPITFVVDKTPPVGGLIEGGKPFVDGAILDHDAVPLDGLTDITKVAVTASLDGVPGYLLGTPITTEGAHKLVWSAKDAAGWTTPDATINFFIDKTAPNVTITNGNGGAALEARVYGASVTPVINISDITETTTVATLNGATFKSGDIVSEEGSHTLAVTVTDAAGTPTILAPITFVIDKTKPLVRVLETGEELVSGASFNRRVLPQIKVVDDTATTIVAKLGDAEYTPDTVIELEGTLTLHVSVTDAGGNVTDVPPITFLIDRTKPVVTITHNGAPFVSDSFKHSVTPVIAVEDITPTTVVALLNDQEFKSGTEIVKEGRYTLSVTATDQLNWVTTVPTIGFAVDMTAPIVQLVVDGKPLEDGAVFNEAIAPKAIIDDVTDTEVIAKLNGVPYVLETTIDVEGDYVLDVRVTDDVGLYYDVPTVHFRIDTTRPVLTFITPANQQSLVAPRVLVSGTSDDSVSVGVNGVAAEIDAQTKRFTVPSLELLEGKNTIVAVGTDLAGNVSDPISVEVTVDTRAPEVVIASPAANACLTTKTVQVSGTINDPNVATVSVAILPGDTPAVSATLSADKRSWSATLQFPSEGKFVIAVTARDHSAHEAVTTVQVRIDETKPRIEITESGAPFLAPFVNRTVAPFVRVTDADPNARLTITLDGAPYTSGTPIALEKTYELKATAADCAGHNADEVIVRFTIDKTAPQFLTHSPANGASVGSLPTVSGTVSPDTASVFVEENGAAATVSNGSFTFPALAIREGANRFTLVAVDRAGNPARVDYSFNLKTSAPTVSISESGSPIANGARYARPVIVDVVPNEAGAIVTATHNGQPFTSGTTISANGSHTISATARDSFGHTSAVSEVTFTIDVIGPIVTIIEPQDGANVTTATVRVRGTITGDPISATINGAPLTLAGGAFDTNVALEPGLNEIAIVALDAAGNSGVGRVEVNRGGGTLGLILNSPVGSLPTNRRTAIVAGQVLSPRGISFVTVNGIEIPIDAAGAFRKTDFPLAEGQNVITAIVRKDGAEGSVSVTVTADFTPPAVTVRESGNALEDEARFGTEARITVAATDGGQSITPTILIDAAPAVSPAVVNVNGGHTILVVARDAAGNETRVERTFFIGGGAGGGCALADFDPATGSIITADHVTLVGRTGGAAGVKVNGTAAVVSAGSFTATVNLSVEGENTFSITCTDANGNPVGQAKTLTLIRATGAPSIDITAPDHNSVTASEINVVRGTIAGEVSEVTVNGSAATITGNTFTASDVRLAEGVNVVVARARNAAGRTATDSVHVTWLKNLPSITITSPTTALTVRTATLDVSGVWTNLDPASLTVTRGGTAAPAETQVTSDTSGTFRGASVPLIVGLQTITVRGLDRLGRSVEAKIDVTRADGKPSIAITTPADNTYYGSSAGATFTVSGTFNGGTAATVEVNGETATLDGANFTATVPFSSLLNTPVVARVTEPDGTYAIDTLRVSRLGAAPRVVKTFPDTDDAVDVSSGVLPLVLFSAPMDRASVRGAFRLENASGTAVSGDVILDRDVLTFAPAALLAAGERFTIRVAAGAQDLAGNAMASAFARSFTVAATAAVNPPTLNPYATRVCGSLVLTGTAAPNAHIRIHLGTLTFNLTASATGAFTFTLPLSGRSGFQVARVRVVGSDGSLSTAAEAQFEVDCAGPQVTNAAYDRGTNALTITFSKAVDLATVTTGANGSVLLRLTDGSIVGGTVSALAAASSVSVVPAQDLREVSFTLTVTTAVLDTAGAALTSAYSRAFTIGEPTLGDGAGYISGEVFDADTGRPLPGATVSVEVPVGAFAKRVGTQSDDISTTAAVVGIVDNRGRYLRELPEGAHTIRASADTHTTVWRQIIVRTGAGVIPTDIRLTRRGVKKDGNGAALVLHHGGAPDTPLALPAELRVPAAMVATGQHVTLTSVGAQSLAGLLPLGWSPLASAEILTNAPSLSGAELEFTVPDQNISSASQTLTAVRYSDDRDEWRVIESAVTIGGGKAKIAVSAAGAYALVYPDKDPRLAKPADPIGGGPLAGVADPCLATPNPCAPLAAKEALQLQPPVVLPTQRTVATLRIEGAGTSLFPSGTAVQAYVDEELRLADGTRDVVAPFATDLLLYRNLAGDTGEAVFHLAPSKRASEVALEIGYDHIRIVPYPDRLDRGALIGPEGGRVPADDRVAVEIPAGATTDALSATAVSIKDFGPYGTIPGYRIVGGLDLTMQWAGEGAESSPVELVKPARATFTVTEANLPSQLILVEMLEGTSYGRIFRLASQITALEGGTRFSTKTIDRAVLPVDGIVREGRYLLLAPNAPIAFATGTVHLGVNGTAVNNARVLTPPLGVIDLTRVTGIFNVPVPAALFSLVPRTLATGDGAAYNHPTAPAIDAVVNVGALGIVAQPPTVTMTVFVPGASGLTAVTAEGATGVATNTSVNAAFSPGVDPQSVTLTSLTVINDSDGKIVPGRAVAQGSTGILWTLEPGSRLNADTSYTAVVSPSVRSSNGTPVGNVSATFATVSTLSDPNVDPSKIRITMPDANGRANIIGAPGALKEGWNAVAVRRFRDFSNRPQDVADAQSSFLIELGTGSDPVNFVTIADEIYLQIINPAGAVAAIVPLGPFTTDDGRGFVARAGKESVFTTIDNITVAVPAEAFDVPTLVRVDKAAKTVFEDVPGFNEELAFFAGFRIAFEGRANKRLELTFDAPANLPADKTPLLGMRGMSALGPRIMVIDLLRRDGTKLTTVPAAGDNASSIRTQGVRADAIINPLRLRNMLLGIDQAAEIIGFTFNTSVAWITFHPPPHPPDFFIPPIKSIYYASFAAERGEILVPVAAGGAFNIVGVDPGSGLEVFNTPYTALNPGEPNLPTEVALPDTNVIGPYPVFASPGRVATIEILADDFVDESIRNMKATFNGSSVIFTSSATPLPPDTHVEVVNVRSGNTATTENFASAGLTIAAQKGDQLIVMISEHDVDPNTNVTIVFSEGVDESQLKEDFKLQMRDPSVSGSTFQDVPKDLLEVKTNSGGRRVSVIARGGYQRGKLYRLTLASTIKDAVPAGATSLALGQHKGSAAPDWNLHIDFSVRAPKGVLDTFNLTAGSVRDLAMIGNVLFVSATEGGIFAYDASNPVLMGDAPPFAHINPPPGGTGASWGLATDLHGRLYATGVSTMYGVVRSYRIEDFACGVTKTCPPTMPDVPPANQPPDTAPNIQKGNVIVTWRTGINVGVPLSSMMIGGWPEAIPRKIRVVTRDNDPVTGTFESLVSGMADAGNGFKSGKISLTGGGTQYETTRVTVVNVTRDYRWSADVKEPKEITIFGHPTDELQIIRNLSTVGVVSLYGYGVGVYDLNAVDSNYHHLFNPSWERLEMTYVLSDGQGADAVDCDRGQQATQGRSCEIGALTYSPEAAVTVMGESLSILVLDQYKGLLHLTMAPGGAPATFGRPGSMIFAEKVNAPGLGQRWFGHPRVNQLRRLYQAKASRLPMARYSSVDTFKRNGKTYALVTGLDYGVMVVRLDPKMKAASLVDVVWVPAGAQSVRVSAAQDLAVVVDGHGRVLLVNLAGLDESTLVPATVPGCSSIDCEWPLFPSALAAIQGPNAGPDEVGSDDPRIVWKSPDPIVFGSIAPIFDSETGFVYTGDVLSTKMSVTSAVDPRLRFVGQTGVGPSPSSMKLLDRIVPLGIKPPEGSVAGVNGSLGAFRLQALIPGSMQESSTPDMPPGVVVDTERVLGVASAQTPEPLPRSRFRGTGTRPVTGFSLRRDAPDDGPAEAKKLRFQRGWNRMVSPWIVAIADPRASEQYTWTGSGTKEEAGCFSCERPEHLKTLPEPEVFELYTAGRYISAYPVDAGLPPGWDWLAEKNRLKTRVNTVMADTVRPIPVLVAAQAPPIAGGMLQETTYLHSGEVESTSLDFDAGGRAGWNVVVDRTYRSRTLYESPLGAGWDSSLFRRLRQLPTNEVEYRDGEEVWTFKPGKGTAYTSPAGLALSLKRIDTGWMLVDQKFRITTFDELGRMIRESDEFFKPSDPDSGNVIQYGYDGDGNLSTIIDPVGRPSKLRYYTSGDQTGLLREFEDWHESTQRFVNFEYDGDRRLTKVLLPDVVNTSGARPAKSYEYSSVAGNYADKVELRTNLEKLFDPNGIKRVTFEYKTGGADRDRVVKQTWGTGETATMGYTGDVGADVTDALGQARTYTMSTNNATDVTADRAHVTELVETSVPVWSGATFGQLPSTVTAGEPSNLSPNRVWKFGYENGMQTSVTLEGVSNTTIGYTAAPNGAGRLISNATTAPAGTSSGAPWMPPNTATTQVFEYQPDAPTFLQAITAGSKRIESPEPHRKNVDGVPASNDSISQSEKYEKYGLLKESSSSGGTDPSSAGSKSNIEYFPVTAPKHARFLPQYVREGEAGEELVTEFKYPSEVQVIEIDPRGIETITDLDTWGRSIKIQVRKSGSLTLTMQYEYDATGRVVKLIRNQDGGNVTTTYTYDEVGRRKTETTDRIATVGSVTTTNTYNLASREITSVRPGGATITIKLDKLGRVVSTNTNTGSSPIDERYAYDLAGNLVYVTDLFIASASAYDSNGRVLATRGADGTITTTKHDTAGQPNEIKTFNASASSVVAQSNYSFSSGGRLQTATERVEPSISRSTTTVWDGGGRITGIAAGDRAERTTYDAAGRPLSQAAGAGSASSIGQAYWTNEISAHDGHLPKTMEVSERSSPEITTTLTRDTTGSVTQTNAGSLEFKQEYDERGHLTKSNTPGRPMTEWKVDAQGAVETEKLPGGGQNAFTYDGSGKQTTFVDASFESTSTDTDFIGRPKRRTYPDGTAQTVEWEGTRVKSITDRQGRTQTYSYNSKGQLEEIKSGSTVIDRLSYDDAGRMVSWRTPDSEIIYGPEFDMEGRPKRTKQRRFRNGTGIGIAPEDVIDEFEQQHAYNEHGERTFASMPVYPSLTLGVGWTKGIAEQYDAMGNVISILRADAPGGSGASVMSASYRNAGRPDVRTVTTAGGASLVRTYSYSPATSQLVRLSVTNGSGVIAGSEVTFDGLQKASAKLLGLASGARYQHWSYDARSRVTASLYGTTDPAANPLAAVPGRAKEQLSEADFRHAQERVSTLDATTREALATKQIDTTRIDPPTSSFFEQAGHKIKKMTRGPLVRLFSYSGAERTDDGRFKYEYDVKGRLTRATEIAAGGPIRSIAYTYSGTDRVVGRRAEYSASVSSPVWQLEDRPQVLAADGLPADTTFVWDPISDRLVSIFKAGATSTDPQGGLLKQVIHGGAGYDDPIETSTIDPVNGGVTHLYPIYDEAGAGSLQAIVNTNGYVVARNLSRDPYGADDVALAGATIDDVQIEVEKLDGTIRTVTITMHATEELTESTIAAGGRLAAVDTEGRLVRTSAVVPVRVAGDPFALQWTLTAGEWTALNESAPVVVEGAERIATMLSVAATTTLRASQWSSELPLLPAPDWVEAVKPVFHSDTLAVEVREPISTLATFTNGSGPNTTAIFKLYEVDSLALLGQPSGSNAFSDDIVSARMHAHPFTEPLTGLNYVRNRWYDPTTGSWLSPDPVGYRDSSNLYSYAGSNPVDNRDSDGAQAAQSIPALAPGVTPVPPAAPPVKPPLRLVPPLQPGTPPVKGPGPAGPVAIVLIGYELVEAYSRHVEHEADEYVEEQKQVQNQIKIDAAKRRNGGTVLAPRVMPKPAPAAQQKKNEEQDCTQTRAYLTVKMQGLVYRAVAEISSNPKIAETLMTPGSYRHLVKRTGLYHASFGKAVERRVRDYVAADPELAVIIKHTGMERGDGGKFISSPDFTSLICRPLAFEVTTIRDLGAHQKRSGGDAVVYLLYEVPENVTFK